MRDQRRSSHTLMTLMEEHPDLSLNQIRVRVLAYYKREDATLEQTRRHFRISSTLLKHLMDGSWRVK